MELKIACGTWIKEEDEKVLTALQKSDRWLSIDELVEKTGLPRQRVCHTLRMLKQQAELCEKRKAYFGEAENSKGN